MQSDAGWTFLTNHSHVLLCLADDPDMRLRDVADRVGITERAVQNVVADLEAAGILTRRREGRRNHYDLHPDHPLRHPVEAHCRVSDLLAMAQLPHSTPVTQTQAANRSRSAQRPDDDSKKNSDDGKGTAPR